MKHDRRIRERRRSWEAKSRHGGLANLPRENAAQGGELAPAIETAESSRRESARLREKWVQLSGKRVFLQESLKRARHGETHARAHDAPAAQRKDQTAGTAPPIHDAQVLTAAQERIHSKLIQANEHLVVASIQFQVMAEELERSKADMAHLVTHDFLTGLPNRMQLNDRIAQAMSWTLRHDVKLAVLFLDLDRFKSVNDTLGHAIGDALLQSVAQRFKSAIRSGDTVSRRGGDEFVLVLFGAGQDEAIVKKIEEIRDLITAPYRIAGNEIQIGASIGISVFPGDGEDAETLIHNADTAMYHAKALGTNRYQFFTQEMRTRELEQQAAEAGIYGALAKREFVLFYQAQVDLERGAIKGAEALIRWRHPSRGLLLPGAFVPAAEDIGAIVPIGRWVLREACAQAQAWLDAGLALDVIAVNISAREFENVDFEENLCAVLRETGLAPQRLELELTETVLMKDIESTVATLDAIRAMGVRISIDDFGTGYSSLSYLKRFPIDTIKIDQSFVRDISTGEENILVNAIIGIGKGLRHQVIAEGVETAQELAFLRENRCTAVQGFYLNIPMAAEEFATVLRNGMPAHIRVN